MQRKLPAMCADLWTLARQLLAGVDGCADPAVRGTPGCACRSLDVSPGALAGRHSGPVCRPTLLRQRLLADPWIYAADVERELPASIHIRVRERVPIAVLKLDRLFYLDETGEVFKSVQPSDQVRVPVVAGLTVSDIGLDGQGHSPVFNAMMEVLHLSRLHGSVLPLDAIHHIQADPETGLTLVGFKKGLAIKLGFGDYESKFNRLRDMMSYFRRGDELLNIACIDLNDLERVVVRPTGGVSLLGVAYRKEI